VLWNLESMADGYLSVWESSQIQNVIKVLNATAEEFITFFLKINLVCVSSQNMPDDVATGNSRDAPKRFLFSCQNQQCTRTFFSMLLKQQHEVNCKCLTIRNQLDVFKVTVLNTDLVFSPK
jgi:hypothetical protein